MPRGLRALGRGIVISMYGPLLINLLPPEQLGEAARTPSDQAPYILILLLAGILLSLWLRPPSR